MLQQKNGKGRVNKLIIIDWTNTLNQENKQLYDDQGLECIYQSFFWLKDGTLFPGILFFSEKTSGPLIKMSLHKFV